MSEGSRADEFDIFGKDYYIVGDVSKLKLSEKGVVVAELEGVVIDPSTDRPVPRAVEFLRKRKDAGYRLVAVTWETAENLEEVLGWAGRAGVEFDALIVRDCPREHYDPLVPLGVWHEVEVAEYHAASVETAVHALANAVRGSFYWYRFGEYVYAPPMLIAVNGEWHHIVFSWDTLRDMLRAVHRSRGPEAEIRYGDYIIRLPKRAAGAFIRKLYTELAKHVCYPVCRGFSLKDAVGIAAKFPQYRRTVKIFGEMHPSYLEFDFDAAFGNPRRFAGLEESEDETEKHSA